MEIYNKRHTNKKAMASHLEKLKKKGANITIDGLSLIYYFGDKLREGSIVDAYGYGKVHITNSSIHSKTGFNYHFKGKDGKIHTHLLNSKDKILKIY